MVQFVKIIVSQNGGFVNQRDTKLWVIREKRAHMCAQFLKSLKQYDFDKSK
jgi:hypothetical protein